MTEEDTAAVGHLEVTHCPLCGDSASPKMAVGDEESRWVLVECDRCGTFEVEVSEA